MTKRDETTSRVKSSSRTCAPDGAKSVSECARIEQLKLKFKVEKYAKNEAYHFILSHGLYDDFVVFCRAHNGEHHHLGCLKSL